MIEPYCVEKLKGAVATQSNGQLPKQSAIVSTGEQKRWSNLPLDGLTPLVSMVRTTVLFAALLLLMP
jgi:hypothetical protein